MNLNLLQLNTITLLSLLLASCGNSGIGENSDNNSPIVGDSSSQAQATLKLVANGEDFVRQGFVTKDGWQINFERLDVNLVEVKAYQVEGAFKPTEADRLDNLKYQDKVSFLDTPQVIDLAAGEADAEPIMVASTEANPGFYNAIAWKIDTGGAESTLAGKTMVFQGTATKDEQVIDFDISLNRPIQYLCGEYVGDERKGIIQAGQVGELETTFHFDHLFGDSETSPDNALNLDSLGFEPLAKLASGDSLTIDDIKLNQQLSPEDQEKLTEAIISLGHVGEGHCIVIQ